MYVIHFTLVYVLKANYMQVLDQVTKERTRRVTDLSYENKSANNQWGHLKQIL